MKKRTHYLLGLALVLSLLMAACVTSVPSPEEEISEATLNIVTEESKATETEVPEEPGPTESVVTQDPEPSRIVDTKEPEQPESMVTEDPEPTASEVLASESTQEEVEEQTSFTSPLIGELAQDFTLSDGDGNMVSLSSLLQEYERLVIVFYYGYYCVPCMAQLTEIATDRAEYEGKGAQVIAVAVQKESGARRSVEISGAEYPILADEEHAVAKAFGVYEGGSYSTPSVFIINKDQEIVWGEISHIEGGDCGSNRIPSQTILENLG